MTHIGKIKELVGYAVYLAGALDAAERIGQSEDNPEGAHYIQISDTAAHQIADHLRAFAAGALIEGQDFAQDMPRDYRYGNTPPMPAHVVYKWAQEKGLMGE